MEAGGQIYARLLAIMKLGLNFPIDQRLAVRRKRSIGYKEGQEQMGTHKCK